MPEQVTARRTRVWKSPAALGDPEAIRGMGGIVAPLLAGFSLTTVALLVTIGDATAPWGREFAILSFVVSACSFVAAMQFAFTGLRYSTPPDQRLAWRPEARLDPIALGEEREIQAQERDLLEKYSGRAALFYNLGILAFLMGFAFLVVPKTKWDLGRILSVVFVGLSGVVEVLWTYGRWGPLGPLSRVFLPSRDDIEAQLDPLDNVSRRAISARSTEKETT